MAPDRVESFAAGNGTLAPHSGTLRQTFQEERGPCANTTLMRFVSRVFRLLIEYVLEFEFGGFLKSRIDLRGLGPHRRLGWVAVVLVLALVAATPLLYYTPLPLSRTAFQDARDRTYFTPMAAVYLTLAGLGTGWGFILAGAAYAGAAAYAAAALFYVYLVTGIGFGLGRSPWMAVPPLVIVSVLAASPLYRRGPQIRLLLVAAALFAADLALRLTGVHRQLGPVRGWGWIAAGLLMAGLAHALGRRRAWSPPALVGLAGGVTLVFLTTAATGNPTDAAGWTNLSLVSAVALLSVLWFLLGGNLVDGAAALTRFAHKALGELVPRRFSTMGSRVIMVALGGLFAYATYRAWKAQTTGLPEEVEGPWAMALFIFTIAWDLLTKSKHVPETGWKGWPAPGPLLCYLGVTLLLVSAFHFHTVGRLTFTLHEMFLAQLRGATVLVIPYLFYRGIYWQQWVTPPPRAPVLRAFLVGALASLPPYALRMALRPGGLTLSPAWTAVLGASALCMLGALATVLLPAARRDGSLAESGGLKEDGRFAKGRGLTDSRGVEESGGSTENGYLPEEAGMVDAGATPGPSGATRERAPARALTASVTAIATGIGFAVFFLEGVSIHLTTTVLTMLGSLFRLGALRRASVTLQDSYLFARHTTAAEILVIALGGTLALLVAAAVMARARPPHRPGVVVAALAIHVLTMLGYVAVLAVLPLRGAWLAVAVAIPVLPALALVFPALRASLSTPPDPPESTRG